MAGQLAKGLAGFFGGGLTALGESLWQIIKMNKAEELWKQKQQAQIAKEKEMADYRLQNMIDYYKAKQKLKGGGRGPVLTVDMIKEAYGGQ